MYSIDDKLFWRLFLLFILIGFFIQTYNEHDYSNQKINEKFNAVLADSSNQGICSKLCCFSGWPNSIDIQDKNIKQSDIGTIYNTTNYTCNDGFKTGCLCDKI